jgi:hypothetical protein
MRDVPILEMTNWKQRKKRAQEIRKAAAERDRKILEEETRKRRFASGIRREESGRY